MNWIAGQKIKTEKGVFQIIGVWWQQGEKYSYEILNLSNGKPSHILAKTLESKLTEKNLV